jgi:hypothetical protein
MKFEYKQIEVSIGLFSRKNKSEQAEETLNELGAEGWELVNCVSCSQTGMLIYVFKRPKKEGF